MNSDSLHQCQNSSIDSAFAQSFNSTSPKKLTNPQEVVGLKRIVSDICQPHSEEFQLQKLNKSEKKESDPLKIKSPDSEFYSTNEDSDSPCKARLENVTIFLQDITDKTYKKALYLENAKNREELALIRGQEFDRQTYIQQLKNKKKQYVLMSLEQYTKIKGRVQQMKLLESSRLKFQREIQDQRERQRDCDDKRQIELLGQENKNMRKNFNALLSQVDKILEGSKKIGLTRSINILQSPNISLSQSSIYRVEDINEISQELNILSALAISIREDMSHQSSHFSQHRDSLIRNHGIAYVNDGPTTIQTSAARR